MTRTVQGGSIDNSSENKRPERSWFPRRVIVHFFTKRQRAQRKKFTSQPIRKRQLYGRFSSDRKVGSNVSGAEYLRTWFEGSERNTLLAWLDNYFLGLFFTEWNLSSDSKGRRFLIELLFPSSSEEMSMALIQDEEWTSPTRTNACKCRSSQFLHRFFFFVSVSLVVIVDRVSKVGVVV